VKISKPPFPYRGMEANKPTTAYPTLTPAELAAELGVPLSQRRQPDFSAAVPNRFVTLAEAIARKLSWCYDIALGECRYHHLAARRVSNTEICADCERVKKGLEPIYGRSVVNKHYDAPRRSPKDPSAAAAASPAKPELAKKDRDIVTALAETRDFDRAAERVGCTRGQLDAQLAVSEPLRKAVDELGIMKSRAPDAPREWTDDLMRRLRAEFINTGSLTDARTACNVSASEFYEQMERSPEFAAAIDAARPRAKEVLKDRATQAAVANRPELLKYLESQEEEDSISSMSVEQLDAELARLLKAFDSQGLICRTMRHRVTGEVIDTRDYDFEPLGTERAATDANLDLVGAP